MTESKKGYHRIEPAVKSRVQESCTASHSFKPAPDSLISKHVSENPLFNTLLGEAFTTEKPDWRKRCFLYADGSGIGLIFRRSVRIVDSSQRTRTELPVLELMTSLVF